MSFKGNFSLEKRREIYQKESYMHPHRVAIVVEMHPKSKLQVERFFKFMANATYTIGSVQETIKKELVKTGKLANPDTTALYFFCGKKLLKSSDVLKDLSSLKDPEDSFLYLMIAETETF